MSNQETASALLSWAFTDVRSVDASPRTSPYGGQHLQHHVWIPRTGASYRSENSSTEVVVTQPPQLSTTIIMEQPGQASSASWFVHGSACAFW